MKNPVLRFKIILLILLLPIGLILSQTDPLPSWNESNVKSNIINFVNDITNPGSSNYVAAEDRIATFDNDGTLWCEMPTIQVVYTFLKVKEMFPGHPEWKDEKIFMAVLNDDKDYIEQDIESGGKGLMQVLAATNSGIDVENFKKEYVIFLHQPNIRNSKCLLRKCIMFRCLN